MFHKIICGYLNLRRILKQQRGAATAEYALILALVVVALMATLGELQGALTSSLEDIIDSIKGVG